ncbi:MAG: hypothetical protein AAF405_02600 [Pseudomonadota bacterium]
MALIESIKNNANKIGAFAVGVLGTVILGMFMDAAAFGHGYGREGGNEPMLIYPNF